MLEVPNAKEVSLAEALRQAETWWDLMDPEDQVTFLMQRTPHVNTCVAHIAFFHIHASVRLISCGVWYVRECTDRV